MELKLLSSKQDEGVLDLCFKYAWRIKVQLVKHARRQIQKLREDIHCRGLLAERAALKTAKDRFAAKRRTAIDHELNDIRMSYGLTKYQFKLWVQPLQHRYGRYIDSRTAQCIADDIWTAVDKYIFGDGKRLHIPHLNDVHSIESNDNKTGIRYRSGHILWKSLNMQISRDKSNSYESEALTRRVKYCRIVRKQFPGRWHYYVQLVMEGTPPQKHVVGSGRVGIDPGTLSAAVVSGRACILTALNDGVSDHENQIKRIQRAMDRSRRSMNPDNYKSDGTVRKGHGRWVYSKRYRALQRAKRSLERRQAASLKCHHERLANDILELGDDVYTEDMNYRGLRDPLPRSAGGGRRFLLSLQGTDPGIPGGRHRRLPDASGLLRRRRRRGSLRQGFPSQNEAQTSWPDLRVNRPGVLPKNPIDFSIRLII